MVQRSDDNGDKRSQSKSSEAAASPDADPGAVKALRERIRQAGSATARASDHAPPSEQLLVPHSSAPPAAESSGIRARPTEPRSISITPPLFSATTPKLAHSPMSVPWPAGPLPRTRSLSTTRVGLGVQERGELLASDQATSPDTGRPPVQPPRSAASEAEQAARDELSLSTARTQPMPRFEDGDGSGDPDDAERRRVELATTRRTQGLLRAPDGVGTTAGRYSIHDVSAEYVATGLADELLVQHHDHDEQHHEHDEHHEHDAILESDDELDGQEPALRVEPAERDAEPAPEDEREDDGEASRPRRSTPKQRVGHRRASRPELAHARVERVTKRTDPGLRARTQRGVSPPVTPSKPAAATKSASLAVTPAPGPRGRALGVSTAPLRRATAAGAAGPSRAPTTPTAPSATDSPSAPKTPTAPSEPVPLRSIVVDPSLSWPPQHAQPAASRPPPRAAAPRASSYVPLPRDREAYDAFLRSAAAEGGGAPARARPSWAQQETALIPRDALEAPPDEVGVGVVSLWRNNWVRSAVGVGCIVIGALGVGWSLRDETVRSASQTPIAPAKVTAAPAQPPPVAAAPVTLISTEPSGAELLVGGAVVGNTPFEVQRPSQGDELYKLRMRGFESQMVKISSHSRDAMHITLNPVAPPPSRSRR